MGRTSPLRRSAVLMTLVAALSGVVLGFWPVSVTVIGGVPYSCGSGFIHSRHTWKVDSRTLRGTNQPVGVSTATPNKACPRPIYRHRDVAYALIALGVIAYLALLATADA